MRQVGGNTGESHASTSKTDQQVYTLDGAHDGRENHEFKLDTTTI